MQPRKLAVSAVAIVAVLGGCGDGSGAEDPARPAAAPLDGTYVATFSGRERSGPSDPGPERGRWTLRLRGENGSYNNVPKGFGYPIGPPIRIAGDTMTLGPTEICAKSPAGARYRFARQARVLRFTKISDGCAARVTLLTAHPWRRVSTDPEAKVS